MNYAKFGFDFVKQSNQIGPLFHNIALQQYILLCAQVKKHLISFMDFLSSCFQNFKFLNIHFVTSYNSLDAKFHIVIEITTTAVTQVLEGGLRDKPGKNRDHYHSCYCLSGLSVSQHSAMTGSDSCPLPQHMLGPYSNLLEPIHPLYNVVLDKYDEAHEFFSRK